MNTTLAELYTIVCNWDIQPVLYDQDLMNLIEKTHASSLEMEFELDFPDSLPTDDLQQWILLSVFLYFGPSSNIYKKLRDLDYIDLLHASIMDSQKTISKSAAVQLLIEIIRVQEPTLSELTLFNHEL
jgi:hypothetical protein